MCDVLDIIPCVVRSYVRLINACRHTFFHLVKARINGFNYALSLHVVADARTLFFCWNHLPTDEYLHDLCFRMIWMCCALVVHHYYSSGDDRN